MKYNSIKLIAIFVATFLHSPIEIQIIIAISGRELYSFKVPDDAKDRLAFCVDHVFFGRPVADTFEFVEIAKTIPDLFPVETIGILIRELMEYPASRILKPQNIDQMCIFSIVRCSISLVEQILYQDLSCQVDLYLAKSSVRCSVKILCGHLPIINRGTRYNPPQKLEQVIILPEGREIDPVIFWKPHDSTVWLNYKTEMIKKRFERIAFQNAIDAIDDLIYDSTHSQEHLFKLQPILHKIYRSSRAPISLYLTHQEMEYLRSMSGQQIRQIFHIQSGPRYPGDQFQFEMRPLGPDFAILPHAHEGITIKRYHSGTVADLGKIHAPLNLDPETTVFMVGITDQLFGPVDLVYISSLDDDGFVKSPRLWSNFKKLLAGLENKVSSMNPETLESTNLIVFCRNLIETRVATLPNNNGSILIIDLKNLLKIDEQNLATKIYVQTSNPESSLEYLADLLSEPWFVLKNMKYAETG